MKKILEMISKFFKNILTEIDGESYDIMRISLFLGSLGMLGMALISVLKSGVFNATDFGAGYGGLMAAGGSGMAVRGKFETDQKKAGSGSQGGPSA